MGATMIIGTDIAEERIALARELGLVDHALKGSASPDSNDSIREEAMALTGGTGCEVSIDCSGAGPARKLALTCTRQWGRCVFVGEGGGMEFDVSPLLIHPQITIYGSWVTSLKHMEELVERLDRWNLHPERTVTHRLPLDRAAEAYKLADKGRCGKVCIVFE